MCALDVKANARVKDKGLQPIPDCGSSSSRFYEKTAPTTIASLIFSNMQHVVDVEINEESEPARNPPYDGQRGAEGVNKHFCRASRASLLIAIAPEDDFVSQRLLHGDIWDAAALRDAQIT